MQIPVKIDVPLGTVLALSVEMDIDNERTLTTWAAMLHLAETVGPELPEGALAEAVFYAFEAHTCGDHEQMDELWPDLLGETQPLAPGAAHRRRRASDDPMQVPLSVGVSVEDILEWGAFDYERDGSEDKLLDMTLHELASKYAAYVPAKLLTAAIYQGYLQSRSGHKEDAGYAFEGCFVQPLRKLHREARRAREEWMRGAA